MDIPKLPGDTSGRAKDFLTSNEKWTGRFTVAVIACLAIWVLNAFGPAINNGLSQLISILGKTAAIVAISLAGVAAAKVLTSKWFQTMLWYKYTAMARNITNIMITSDPIGTMKSFADEYLSQQLAKFRQKMGVVTGTLNWVEEKIEGLTEDIEGHRQAADTLRKQYYYETNGTWAPELRGQQFESSGVVMQTPEALFRLEAQQHEMKAGLLKKLQARRERLIMLNRLLVKFQQAFDFQISLIRAFVDVLEIEYESARATADATQVVAGLVQGDEKKKVFDAAVSFTRRRTAEFVGQVETFMNTMPAFLGEFDTAGDAAESAMMAQLQGWSNAADRLIEGTRADQELIASGKLPALMDMSSRGIPPLSVAVEQAPPKAKPRRRLLGDTSPRQHRKEK